MAAKAAKPSGTLTVTVKRYGHKSRRVKVPVRRIESLYGYKHWDRSAQAKLVNSWVGLTPVKGKDPLKRHMHPSSSMRLEVAEAPWKLAGQVKGKGVDLVKVFDAKYGNKHMDFAVRDQIVAVIPTAVDSAHMMSLKRQGGGCVLLRSGDKLSGYEYPKRALLDRIFGKSAVRVPTSSGVRAAVLPEFYRGAVGFNGVGRLMVGVAMGEGRKAKVMRVETAIDVDDVRGALRAGAKKLKAKTKQPVRAVA